MAEDAMPRRVIAGAPLGYQVDGPLFAQRCPWCKGEGRKRRPCPLCGRMTGVAGGVDSLWTESERHAADGDR